MSFVVTYLLPIGRETGLGAGRGAALRMVFIELPNFCGFSFRFINDIELAGFGIGLGAFSFRFISDI